MTTDAETLPGNNQYRVISVEKTDPPEGMTDGDWYHYIIGYGRSKIEGLRCGTRKAVTQHAEDFAENLSTRTTKGYSAYAARKQKK